MKFGTSGLRGLVSEMTDPVCAAHVAAFVRHLGRDGIGPGGEILIGRDLRPSSPRIAEACARGARAAGAVPVDCGVVPTPALALEALRRGVPAVMVSGSHIPFDRNGLKFYRADGEITKADETGILDAFSATGDAALPAAPPAQTDTSVGTRYVARTVDFFPSASLSGQRIGVWQHSAAGRDLLATALAALGAEVIPLGRTDSFVPIDTEAVAPEDAVRIRRWVTEHRLDALASTDGDSDRPLLADETGTVLRGDALGTLAAHALAADAVATPLNASTALERTGWFPWIARTRIGSPYVIEGLATLTAQGARLPVGYEANGGFLLGGTARNDRGGLLAPLPTRDALLPILAVLVAAGPGPLSALVASLPPRATASDRLKDIPDSVSAPLLARLATTAYVRSDLIGLSEADVMDVNTEDGVRMTLASGDIVHLRASGNAPELRVYTEAATPARAGSLLAAVLDRLAGTLDDR